MVLRIKKDVFLSYPANKQRFIYLLGDKLQRSGYTVLHAPGDADLAIVETAIQSAKTTTTALVGEDTDLLILLCHYADANDHDILFMPQTKQKSGTMRVWNIKNTVEALGPDICKNIMFAHAILGCDTTSALYGLGKGLSLKMLTSDVTFRQQADIFHQADAAKNDIAAAAGETALLCLYKGLKDETLDSLRYARFCQKISTGNTQVRPESLPQISAAAIYHSLRVYHQVQQWRGIALPPEDWGWKEVDGKLLPQRTDQSAAHPSLLELIRCNCKTGCSSRKCSCKRHDLDCTAACGTCRGQSCDNSSPPDLSKSD
ncbi:predicted protein [Nematostella vectensis]|uniref:Tesmin/TSO1-like CXC domain-containing protein n=1 Tax=Nematostella vectensis TaxID=45351 RepID=A7SB43_NEMVE|nr:predicted protein [Nematostella vectensis]|eukprot:XP_001631115.1 predicted protein [Nematostella vectensis]